MTDLKKNKTPHYAYMIIALLFLFNFVANYPQYQLSPLAYLLIPQLDLSTTQFSMLFSSAMIPGIALGIVSGLLCDRFGTKRCIAITGIIAVVGAVGRIFCSDFISMFLCMLLIGISASFINNNLAKIAGTWFPPEKVSTMVGIGLAGCTFAMAFGMGTTAMLPSTTTAFVLAVIFLVVVLIGWIFLMKDHPKNAEIVQNEAPAISVKECFCNLIKVRHIWVVGISIGMVLAGSMCLSTFLPSALQNIRGFSAESAGSIASIITFGNLFGAVLGPMLCAKIGKMKPFLFLCCLLTAVGYALAWLVPGKILIFALFLTGFISSSIISQLCAVPVMLPQVGIAYAGTAAGIVSTIQLICGVGIPSYVLTPIIGGNFTLLFLVGGALSVVSALLILTLPEVYRK